MVEEYINGKMEEHMMENILMIENMGLEFINGMMEGFMKDFGLKENNTE